MLNLRFEYSIVWDQKNIESQLFILLVPLDIFWCPSSFEFDVETFLMTCYADVKQIIIGCVHASLHVALLVFLSILSSVGNIFKFWIFLSVLAFRQKKFSLKLGLSFLVYWLVVQ